MADRRAPRCDRYQFKIDLNSAELRFDNATFAICYPMWMVQHGQVYQFKIDLNSTELRFDNATLIICNILSNVDGSSRSICIFFEFKYPFVHTIVESNTKMVLRPSLNIWRKNKMFLFYFLCTCHGIIFRSFQENQILDIWRTDCVGVFHIRTNRMHGDNSVSCSHRER